MKIEDHGIVYIFISICDGTKILFVPYVQLFETFSKDYVYVSVCDDGCVCLCAASVVVYVRQSFSVSLYRLKMFYYIKNMTRCYVQKCPVGRKDVSVVLSWSCSPTITSSIGWISHIWHRQIKNVFWILKNRDYRILGC